MGWLAANGSMQSFAFDREARLYVPLSGVPATLAAKWFSITAQGRDELQTNWVEQ